MGEWGSGRMGEGLERTLLPFPHSPLPPFPLHPKKSPRMTGTTRSALLLAMLALLGAGLCRVARADKGLNDGIFRDRDEKAHSWKIQRSHLLVWDDKPYAPAGVVFHSEFLKAPSPDALSK